VSYTVGADEGRAVGNNFGLEVLGGANCGNVRARRWELGEELVGVLSIIASALAVRTNTRVAASEQKGSSTGTDLCELLAHTSSIRCRYSLLIIGVRSGNDLGNRLLR
jgi:hypothetical protein